MTAITHGTLKVFTGYDDIWYRWFLVVGTNQHGTPVNLWLDPPKPGFAAGFSTGTVAAYRILAEAEEWVEPEDQGC